LVFLQYKVSLTKLIGVQICDFFILKQKYFQKKDSQKT